MDTHFDLPSAVLDTTTALPQAGKGIEPVVFDLSKAVVLDTTKAAPLLGKNAKGPKG